MCIKQGFWLGGWWYLIDMDISSYILEDDAGQKRDKKETGVRVW